MFETLIGIIRIILFGWVFLTSISIFFYTISQFIGKLKAVINLKNSLTFNFFILALLKTIVKYAFLIFLAFIAAAFTGVLMYLILTEPDITFHVDFQEALDHYYELP